MIMAKESKKSSSLYKDSHSRSAARLPICTQHGRRSSGSLPIRRQTSGTAKVVMRLRRHTGGHLQTSEPASSGHDRFAVREAIKISFLGEVIEGLTHQGEFD
jgi:hypothetical protein